MKKFSTILLAAAAFLAPFACNKNETVEYDVHPDISIKLAAQTDNSATVRITTDQYCTQGGKYFVGKLSDVEAAGFDANDPASRREHLKTCGEDLPEKATNLEYDIKMRNLTAGITYYASACIFNSKGHVAKHVYLTWTQGEEPLPSPSPEPSPEPSIEPTEDVAVSISDIANNQAKVTVTAGLPGFSKGKVITMLRSAVNIDVDNNLQLCNFVKNNAEATTFTEKTYTYTAKDLKADAEYITMAIVYEGTQVVNGTYKTFYAEGKISAFSDDNNAGQLNDNQW